MAKIEWDIVFKEDPSSAKAPSSTESARTAETAELAPGKSVEKVTGPKADRWKGDPGPSPKKADPELSDALKGLGKFASDRAGLGPVVSTLENLAKHMGNVYQAVMRGATTLPKSPGGRGPDAGSGLEVKSVPRVTGTPVSSIPTGVVPPPIVGPPSAAGAAESLAAPSAAAGEGLEAVAAACAPLAVAAAAAVAALAAVAAGAYAVKSAFDAIHNEGARIQGYSPELSQAHAESALRAELADIRRAQRIGPDAARVEDMRSKVMEKVADIGTELYGEVAELLVKLEPAIDLVISALGLTADSIPHIVDKMTAVVELLSGQPALIADALKEDPGERKNRERMQDAVRRFIEGKEAKEEDDDDPFMLGLLAQFGVGAEEIRVAKAGPPIPAGVRGMGAAGGFGV